jgi:hypothetical protein
MNATGSVRRTLKVSLLHNKLSWLVSPSLIQSRVASTVFRLYHQAFEHRFLAYDTILFISRRLAAKLAAHVVIRLIDASAAVSDLLSPRGS